MTPQTLLAELSQAITEMPADQLAALMSSLAAAQSAAAVRLLNGHQSGAAERKSPSTGHASLLTIPQVAERLNVPRSYAYELVRRQKLPAVRLGKYVRVAQETLAKYIMTAASSAP